MKTMYKIDISSIDKVKENLLSILANCLKNEVGFKIEKISNNKLRVITPFLYEDNDFIELYVSKDEDTIYISDLGNTLEKLMDDEYLNKTIFISYFKENKNIFLDEENFSLYKKVKRLKRETSLARRIIDFANDLQKMEFLFLTFKYFFLKTITIEINHKINIQGSFKNSKEVKKIKKEIEKDIRKDIIKAAEKSIHRIITQDFTQLDNYKIQLEKAFPKKNNNNIEINLKIINSNYNNNTNKRKK